MCLCGLAGRAQSQIGVGAIAAAATYIGDFKTNAIPTQPGVMAGGIVRYTLGNYYALRVNMAGGNLRGNPNKYKGSLLSDDGRQTPDKLDQFFFDADLRVEVGFLPYDVFNPSRFGITPYYMLGAGLFYYKNKPTLQLPFGVGVKYRLQYRWTLSAEWTFAKTFADDVDNWKNAQTQGKTFINKDWMSYVGITISYQLMPERNCEECYY
ncbi:hypothetical protein AGMMS4956_11460 [Bacteroidia bacterium]|nr:hypothetical protein AGMMS4956_11460 [Bacteroidia bacterium]